MDERARRLWAGTEAGAIGYGGVTAVARVTALLWGLEKQDEIARQGRSHTVLTAHVPA